MGIKYKAIMCPSVAGKFVERFSSTLVSAVCLLTVQATNERVNITLEATTDLGECVLADALSTCGEFAQWGYGKRFRAPMDGVLAGVKAV